MKLIHMYDVTRKFFSTGFAIIKSKTSKRKDNTTSYIAGGIAAVSIPSIVCAIYFAARRKKKKRQVSQAEKKPT